MSTFRTVDVIVEEGSSVCSDEDFAQQEAKLLEEENEPYTSRPSAYGEAMELLEQAAQACAEAEEADLYAHYSKSNSIAASKDESNNGNSSDNNNTFVMESSNAEEVPIRGNSDNRYCESDDMVLPALANKNHNEMFDDKVLSPSDSALQDKGQLFPCDVCGRTFLQKTLERHMKICEKVATKKRKVFDGAKKRLEGLPDAPVTSGNKSPKKKPAKPEDEFQKCPTCSRKFGPKAYDRHVTWCSEKARRMQDSPKKDMAALAKLHARVAYRPKTPSRKDSSGSGGSPSRKASNASQSESSVCATPTGQEVMTRSLSRNDSRRKSSGGSSDGKWGTKSLGRSSGISFLNSANHTIETPDTHFVRATTGRGSIKRGPAPTKSSVLRAQKMAEVAGHLAGRSMTPNVPKRVSSPVTPSVRRRAPSPLSSGYGHYSTNYTPKHTFQTLVKPSVVRPASQKSSSSSSYGMRREPEGIEHESKSSSSSGELISGPYDHSQEYDPYQSAARQMQELLFGTSSVNNKDSSSANLRPSTNSAFQKYVPSSNVPTTADINSKFGSARARLESYMTTPKRSRDSSNNGNWESNSRATANLNSLGKGAWETYGQGRTAAKVAKFCHECGNPFALPDIRFCCECGVKRLYC